MIQSEDKAVLSTFFELFNSFRPDKSLVQPTLTYDPEAMISITGLNEYLFNNILLKNPTDFPGLIKELIELKQTLEKPLTVFRTAETNSPTVVEETLKAHFNSPGDFYGMVLEINKANLPKSPEGITIEPVTTETQAETFAKIFTEVFPFPSLFTLMENWLVEQYESNTPISLNYIAKVDGAVAGISSLVIDKNFNEFKAGGFYNAAVLPAFRNSGVGTAMATHRIHMARELGLEYLSIILMSDAMARGYCEKVGFKNYQTLTPFFL